jgi:FAD/FMN-containing dehydrogenase
MSTPGGSPSNPARSANASETAVNSSRLATSLQSRLGCPVHSFGEPGYATETAAFNTAIIHTPDAVVAVTSADDVAETVRAARELGAQVSVQTTGHGAVGAIEGGILISMRALQGVRIDPATREALIAGGSRCAPVISAAAAHGLAPITGSSPNVGVAGLLLGGGIGPLARSHGFSSDYITGMTVVTGTGERLDVGAERHPDLFWALRGGKSGLGIVTEIRLRLVELQSLYGGALFFEEAHIERALRGWIDWTANADPRLTTSIVIIRFPPLDAVPPPLRGRLLLVLRVAYPGDLAEGERLIAPLRALAPVYLDTVGELAAADIARVHNDPTDPAPSWVRGMLLTHVDQAFAAAFLSHVGAGKETPFVAAEVRHIDGATRHDVAGGSAAGGRGAAFTLGFIGANPAQFAVMPAAFARVSEDVRPWTAGQSNINFMARPLSEAHLATAWSAATFTRLAGIRQRYDPDRVFNPHAGY